MPQEQETAFTEQLMRLYDLATKFATKDGRSHREVFQLLCQYLEVCDQLEEKTRELEIMEKKVDDAQKLYIILTAIREGKIGKG